MAGAHWDITARKLAEEQIRERERQYRGIFESTSDGLLIADLDTGMIVEANPAACRMYGYSRDELVGKHATAIVHPSQHAAFADHLAAVRAGGELRRRAVNVRSDGTPFHIEVRSSAFVHQGRPHILGVLRDISDEMESYQRMEQRVEERTRELSTLLDVSKTLTSTLELRPLLELIMDQLQVVAEYTSCGVVTIEGDGYVTHAYRGPLDAELVMRRRYPVNRRSLAWSLLERNEPARALRSVEYVSSLAEMGTAEMRALLFEPRPESLAAEGLVAALTKQAEALRARHGLAVETDLCPEPEASLEVKEALYRIAQEAMHNSVKHAQATRITLRLAADGAGFDPDGSFPGHLGLRSMQERAARFGGAIAIESAPGRGTAIRVTIPPR